MKSLLEFLAFLCLVVVFALGAGLATLLILNPFAGVIPNENISSVFYMICFVFGGILGWVMGMLIDHMGWFND